MLDIFSDPFIFKSSLNAIIINQLGHEEAGQGNGVLREAFALYWKEFYESHMLGRLKESLMLGMILTAISGKQWGGYLLRDILRVSIFPLN